MIQIKRIYDPPSEDDGYRVLIDRLWPRGFSKENAHIKLWLKEIAPSNDLRKWFNHDPLKWDHFRERYLEELSYKKELIMKLKELEMEHKRITLLYSAKDREHNQAVVLLHALLNQTDP